jgi:hypothetical protein
MAADPTEPAFTVLDDVGFIPVELIDVGDRLRPIDAAWAEALGQIMRKDGQRTPIEVCRLPGKGVWTLVTGAHRLAGAALAGLPEIMAIVVGSNALDRRLREVSENLFRRELGPVDRAAFVAELHEIMQARAGIDPTKSSQQIAAAARWSKALKGEAGDASSKIGLAYQINDDVLDQIGLKRTSFFNSLAIHRRIPPSILVMLAGHPVLGIQSDLLKLAKLHWSKQPEVADLLVKGEKRVGAALAILDQKPKPDAQMKLLSAFLGSFDRMGVTEKRGALVNLLTRMSSGLRDVAREELRQGDGAALS